MACSDVNQLITGKQPERFCPRVNVHVYLNSTGIEPHSGKDEQSGSEVGAVEVNEGQSMITFGIPPPRSCREIDLKHDGVTMMTVPLIPGLML